MSGFQNFESGTGDTPDLHSACRLGDLETIKQAYKSCPDKLNSKDAGLGWAPLYRTVICGHFEGAEYLLKQGANPDITNSMGETPLHQAADNSNFEICKLLLNYRANPNSQQNDGDTPLHHAAFRGDCQIVSLLLDNNANPNIQNFMFGRSPLHYAVDSGCCKCINLLINQGADPNLTDKQGKSPLSMEAEQSILAALNSTPAVEEASEIFSNSFNYPKSELVTSQNATNYISDVGGESGMFDTFGLEKLQKVIKTHNLKPIFNWLKDINLEELYEILCDAGYDDIRAMVNQMSGPLPVTEEDLMDSGVKKLGHRLRIITKLKQDAGLCVRIKPKKGLENGNFLQCCFLANNATKNLQNTSLPEWLDSLNAGSFYSNFVDSGFDHYESLIFLISSGVQINSQFLEENLRINNKEIRNRIAKKLEKDLEQFYYTSQSVNISFDEPKTVACDSCLVF